MDKETAKRILLGYRPGTADASEPEILEALRLADSDPELNEWLRQQLACRIEDQTLERFYLGRDRLFGRAIPFHIDRVAADQVPALAAFKIFQQREQTVEVSFDFVRALDFLRVIEQTDDITHLDHENKRQHQAGWQQQGERKYGVSAQHQPDERHRVHEACGHRELVIPQSRLHPGRESAPMMATFIVRL